MSLDTTALLTFLDTHAVTTTALVGAIYDGIAARIRRGQFDTETRTDHRTTPDHAERAAGMNRKGDNS